MSPTSYQLLHPAVLGCKGKAVYWILQTLAQIFCGYLFLMGKIYLKVRLMRALVGLAVLGMACCQ